MFKYAFLFIIFTAQAQANICPKEDYQINVARIKIEGRFQLFFDGSMASCEMKCYTKNIDCISKCQGRNAKKTLQESLADQYSKNYLDCQAVKEIISTL